jgi:hypothetical protein
MTCKNCECEECPDDCICESCTPEVCDCFNTTLQPQDDFGYKKKLNGSFSAPHFVVLEQDRLQ